MGGMPFFCLKSESILFGVVSWFLLLSGISSCIPDGRVLSAGWRNLIVFDGYFAMTTEI